MTAGELLADVLDARTIEKTEFARRLGKSYLTVNRWTKDQGFNKRNQRLAAEELKLDPDFFSRPSGDEVGRAREAYRRKVFAEFLDTDVGKRLTSMNPDVISALNSTPIPPGKRPTIDFYNGMSLLFTRSLDPELAAEAIELNEQVSASLASKGAPRKRKNPAKRPKS